MDSILLSNGRLGIPEALIHAHDALRAGLTRAAAESGQVGRAAKQIAQLCAPHFAQEEEDIFRLFGLLHDLATERVRPDMRAALPMITELAARRDASRSHHRMIDAAIEELLLQSRKGANLAAARVAHALRDHERDEDEGMYPTMLSIDQSLRESLGL